VRGGKESGRVSVLQSVYRPTPVTPQRPHSATCGVFETDAQRKRAHTRTRNGESARPGGEGKSMYQRKLEPAWPRLSPRRNLQEAHLCQCLFQDIRTAALFFKKKAEAGEALALRRISQRRERLAGGAGADLGWELGVIEEAMSIWKRTL